MATAIAAVAMATASAAWANTWDFSGTIETCNDLACGLAGIAVGDDFVGFLKAIDAASGPNSTFVETDVTGYLLVSGDVSVGPDNSSLDDAALTTDAADEIVSGFAEFSGTFDGGIFGPIDLVVSIDATLGTWVVETPFLGLGVVATGTGVFSHEPDGDDLAAIEDNCTELANADQRDADGDGIGSLCDGDFDQNCNVDFADLGQMKAGFFGTDPNLNMNGTGNVDFADLGLLKQGFFLPPGPSGLLNACSN
jgi:hypothetical protein